VVDEFEDFNPFVSLFRKKMKKNALLQRRSRAA